MIKKPPVNLTSLQKDYAIYLPAISGFYSTYISKQRQEKYVPDNRIPIGFDRGIEGMNFLNPDEGYFVYKYGLYSAGHATLDLEKTIIRDSMIQDRDRNHTMVLGDSGGYQIGKGVLKFDWLNFEGRAANKTREDILNWLELTADWSMLLDVPTWACDRNHTAKTGLKTFQDCLDKTRFNNKFFLENRLGNTKFLNVLQGIDWETAEAWYEGVKEFSDPKIWKDKACEGWAMGGANMCKMHITLKRLITLREDNFLKKQDWMHFLGTAQLDWSCYLTSIQRQIRKHINENFTVSFDCASPFIATAHGLVYTNAQHTTKRWSVIMDKAPDNKALAKSDIPFPFESEIGRRLTMGDICYYAPGIRKTNTELGVGSKGKAIEFDPENDDHYHAKPMRNKIKKVGKTSWDSFGYALMMAHNVYCHIVAVQRANQLMDIECAKVKPDWRVWHKLSTKNSEGDEFSDWVPRNILYFDRFVTELFETKTKAEAFEMINRARPFLTDLEGARLQGGDTENYFTKFIDLEHVTKPEEIDFSNQEDPKLRALEEEVKE
jgi:hypothetical protein